MDNVLQKIVNKKKEKIVKYKKQFPQNKIDEHIKKIKNFFDFKKKNRFLLIV